MRNNKGFSLVELIVVIAIMAILAAVAIPTFATFIGKAQIASDVDYMNQVESAIELAYAGQVVTYNTIEVTYNSTSKLPTQVVVKNGETVVATITKSDATDANASAAEKDAALVIDWDYKFQAAEDKAEASDNWSKAPDTVWSLVATN